MERLLTRTETDTHIIYTAGHTRFQFDKRDVSMLQRVFDLAYAYEDTGLKPGDFKKAFNEDAVVKLAAQALGTTSDRLRMLVKAREEGPCRLCQFAPPSSCDGKPCTMCPAKGFTCADAEAALNGGGQ